MVLDRQCAIKAVKEFPNLIVGEEVHVNNCRILTERKNLSLMYTVSHKNVPHFGLP